MKVYKSKISYGLLIFIFIIIFAPIWSFNGALDFNYRAVGISILVYAFVLHLFFTTEYTIDGKILKIKCGFIYKTQVEIGKIKKITKTNTLLSSPAASFDRIELHYNRFDTVVISPKDKVAFAKELSKINPNIDNRVL